MVSLDQKLKSSEMWQKRPRSHIRTDLFKKRLQKAPNIGKMTSFGKSAKLATMQKQIGLLK